MVFFNYDDHASFCEHFCDIIISDSFEEGGMSNSHYDNTLYETQWM